MATASADLPPVWLTAAGALLGRPLERPAPERNRAEAFLREQFADGPRRVDLLRDTAEAQGLNWKTLQRAADALEVDSERRPEPGKRGRGPAWWWLPNTGRGIEDTPNTHPHVLNSSAVNPQVSKPEAPPDGIEGMGTSA